MSDATVVARPPLVLCGTYPSVLAYPGYVREHPDICEPHDSFMHEFDDGSVICLHCVEQRLPDVNVEVYYVLDQIRRVHATPWRDLHGAVMQAAVSSHITPELALRRMVMTSAARRNLKFGDVIAEIASGEVYKIIPQTT